MPRTGVDGLEKLSHQTPSQMQVRLRSDPPRRSRSRHPWDVGSASLVPPSSGLVIVETGITDFDEEGSVTPGTPRIG